MSRKPDPIDVYVGARAKARRKYLGLSQTEVADSLGVTFQQIQKYERGLNRMGSSRLYHMSVHLSVPIPYFFDGADKTLPGYQDGLEDTVEDLMQTEETHEILQAYYAIDDLQVRRKVLQLAQILCSEVPEKILLSA